MTYDIVFTRHAKDDLINIYKYIVYDLCSRENADNQIDRLERRINKLKIFPRQFKIYEKEPWHSRGLRVMPVDNYLVFYVADSSIYTITILRIIYGKREMNRQLSEYNDI